MANLFKLVKLSFSSLSYFLGVKLRFISKSLIWRFMIEKELTGVEEIFIFTHVVFPRRDNLNYRESCLTYVLYVQIPVALICFSSSCPLDCHLTSPQGFSGVSFSLFSFSSFPAAWNHPYAPSYCLQIGSYKLWQMEWGEKNHTECNRET